MACTQCASLEVVDRVAEHSRDLLSAEGRAVRIQRVLSSLGDRGPLRGRRRSLVCLTQDARYKWTHAMRAGFEAHIPGQGPTVCDFWGSMRDVVPRREERISIVFAFADVPKP